MLNVRMCWSAVPHLSAVNSPTMFTYYIHGTATYNIQRTKSTKHLCVQCVLCVLCVLSVLCVLCVLCVGGITPQARRNALSRPESPLCVLPSALLARHFCVLATCRLSCSPAIRVSSECVCMYMYMYMCAYCVCVYVYIHT